jgi:hypothetical protein
MKKQLSGGRNKENLTTGVQLECHKYTELSSYTTLIAVAELDKELRAGQSYFLERKQHGAVWN